MLINSIELKNITTHVSTRIDFEEGENVLMGGNGTGKTTVLTMIGYVLFDHLPGKKKNYVRNGHDNHKKKIKYGTITLWITSSQGDNYTIKRTLGKQSEIIKVIHTDLDDELTEISNNNRLNEWLRNLISLNDNFSLSTIFENAIGVKQGTFTAPFLMSTSNRSKIFAPLLNVHIYKKIWENYLQISHGFSDRIQSIENRKENIQGQLKQKNEDIKEQKEIQKNLNLDEKSFEKSELEFKKLHKQFEDLKSKKKDLDNIHQSIDKLQISKNNSQTNLNNLELRIKDSVLAVKICNNTKNDFDLYEKTLKEEKELDKKFALLQNLEKEFNELSRKETKIETKLSEAKKELDNAKILEKTLPELSKKNDKFLENQKIIIHLEKEMSKNIIIRENLKKETVKLNEYSEEIKKLKKDTQNLSEFEEKISMMDKTQETINNYTIEISTLKTREGNLKKNIQNCKDGKCPLCNQDYKHKEGKSLEEVFSDEIKENTIKQKELTINLHSLKTKFENLIKLKKEMEHISKKKLRLNEIEKIYSDLSKNIAKTSNEIISLKDLESKLKSSKEKQESLEKINKEFTIVQQNVLSIPKNEEIVQNHQKTIEHIRNNKIKPLIEQINKVKDIPQKISHAKIILDKTEKNHTNYQSNYKLSLKLSELKKDFEISSKTIDKIDKEIEEKRKILILTEKSFDIKKYDQKEKDFEEFKEKIHRFKEKLKQNKVTLQKLNTRILKYKKLEESLGKFQNKIKMLEQITSFSNTLRSWFKESTPKITAALMSNINQYASIIYRKIKGDQAISLEWQKDFDVLVLSSREVRSFIQLSGGEQMAAALAIRLSLLKTLTDLDFAFFDEPTTNLDSEKRENLAKCIHRIKGFRQLFVISHDDTFEESADHVIKFTKNDQAETQVEFFS